MEQPGRRVSLLFDLFVVNQRLRRLLSEALAGAELRADEYAVYSLLFEQEPLTATEMSRRMGMPLTTLLDYLKSMDARGHLRRDRHPRDGRARRLSLTHEGTAAHERTHAAWEVMRVGLEDGLAMTVDEIRRALHALDDAALAQLEKIDAEAQAG